MLCYFEAQLHVIVNVYITAWLRDNTGWGILKKYKKEQICFVLMGLKMISDRYRPLLAIH